MEFSKTLYNKAIDKFKTNFTQEYAKELGIDDKSSGEYKYWEKIMNNTVLKQIEKAIKPSINKQYDFAMLRCKLMVAKFVKFENATTTKENIGKLCYIGSQRMLEILQEVYDEHSKSTGEQ